MKIAEGTVVTLAYDITSQSGEIIETSDISGPITFMAGNSGLIRGLDAKIVGMEEGQDETFTFAPNEAFGTSDDAPTKTLSRKDLPQQDLKEGDAFEATVGPGQTVKLVVHAVDGDDNVVVKLVHPLADQEIGMSVKVLGVRAATSAEKAAGRAMTAPPPPPPPA
ncbi:MAG: FKBP-type peptidyl-prolyl cis-trans isomerase [Myxococcota bacterium]